VVYFSAHRLTIGPGAIHTSKCTDTTLGLGDIMAVAEVLRSKQGGFRSFQKAKYEKND
jgi:hypothetical protein